MNDYNLSNEKPKETENKDNLNPILPVEENSNDLGKTEKDNPNPETKTETKPETETKPKPEKNPKENTKSSGIPKGLLNEEFVNTIEINIIKLTKISNKLNEIDSKEFAEEIKFLKEIEKDYANLFGIKLTKSQKELLIKYVK